MLSLTRPTPAASGPSVTILEHLLAILNERDRRLQGLDQLPAQIAEIRTLIEAQGALTDAKFVTYRALIDSQAEKVALALASSDKAVGKAEAATEKRFENVNEFRQTLADQARDLMPRAETEQRLAQILNELASLRGTSRAGATALLGWIIGAIGLVTGVISLVSRFS